MCSRKSIDLMPKVYFIGTECTVLIKAIALLYTYTCKVQWTMKVSQRSRSKCLMLKRVKLHHDFQNIFLTHGNVQMIEGYVLSLKNIRECK